MAYTTVTKRNVNESRVGKTRKIVKALLDSRATGLFMDTKFAKEKEFKLEKFKKPLLVQNMDGTVNVEGAIIHQVECNMFFKEIDVCNLRKTEMILGML